MNVLAEKVDALDVDAIRAALSTSGLRALNTLSVVESTGSTNADALASTLPPDDQVAVYLAEHQSAGRGRRGARWLSPKRSGLCLSIALRVNPTYDVSTLSLACGVGVRRALIELGLRQPMIKWPNDLVVESRKLGGLLVQMRQIPRASSLLVIGLGLNIKAVPTAVEKDALLPICMQDLLHEKTPARSVVAAAMIDALYQVVQAHLQSGFAAIERAWRSADFLFGREVRVHDDGPGVEGIARGVNSRGELMLETNDGMVAIHAGNVSVRPVASND